MKPDTKPNATQSEESQGFLGLPKISGKNFDLSRWIIYIVFAAIFLFFSLTLFDRGFLSPNNLMNIARQVAMVSIMAVGITFVLSAAEIDLSFGAVVALAAVHSALVLRATNSAALALCSALATGLIIGLANGFLVGYVGIPGFLVTLGSSGIITGIARRITNLQSIAVNHDNFVFIFGSGNIGGVSVLFFWMLLVALGGILALNKTMFGRHVLATGGNPTAALYSGIPVKKIKMSVFLISSILAALAGVLYTGRLQGARYTLGENDLMVVIAAVIIGGTSLFGGKGRVLGSVLGAMIMGMINNGLVLMALSVDHQLILRGAIIILAVLIMMKSEKKC